MTYMVALAVYVVTYKFRDIGPVFGALMTIALAWGGLVTAHATKLFLQETHAVPKEENMVEESRSNLMKKGEN